MEVISFVKARAVKKLIMFKYSPIWGLAEVDGIFFTLFPGSFALKCSCNLDESQTQCSVKEDRHKRVCCIIALSWSSRTGKTNEWWRKSKRWLFGGMDGEDGIDWEGTQAGFLGNDLDLHLDGGCMYKIICLLYACYTSNIILKNLHSINLSDSGKYWFHPKSL